MNAQNKILTKLAGETCNSTEALEIMGGHDWCDMYPVIDGDGPVWSGNRHDGYE